MNREEIFREAILENDRRISNICRHFLGSGEEAKDAYQEVLLKVWLNINNFRGESQLKTWICKIAANVCLTCISRAKKNSSMFVPLSQQEHFDSIDDDDYVSGEEDLKMKFFNEFKSKLNDADRLLVTLYLEDIEYAGISQITGISETNARTRIHRIKNQIRKEWEDKYGAR